MMSREIQSSHNIAASLAYVLCAVPLMAIANANATYDASTPTVLDLAEGGMCLLLYAPIFVLPVMGRWRLREFGFGVNATGLVIVLLVVASCGGIVRIKEGWSLADACVEAIVRCGEELFFRGFVYAVILRCVGPRKHGWIAAVTGSSVLFMLVHTSAFRPEYLAGQGERSALLVVVERLVNVFGLAMAFGLVRAGTSSVWPAALAHSIAAGGVLAIPCAGVILAGGWVIGQARGEDLRQELFKAI